MSQETPLEIYKNKLRKQIADEVFIFNPKNQL
jgi:hypothetical protein